MSKFKTGDLVRYVSSSFGVLADDGPTNEWRKSRVGLVLSEDPPLPRRPNLGSRARLYNVLWNDDTKSLIVPEWDLEIVPNET